MIISEKHSYVFVETPRTGSTAISKELRENYNGREILHKHANYHELKKRSVPKHEKYYVFAGVRNPLDEAISSYSKLLSNHLGMYTDPKYFIENGGWVSKKRRQMYKFVQENKEFASYLNKYHKLPYTSNININKKDCDYIIHFEKLDKDFACVLKELNLERKRRLPQTNKTVKDESVSSPYDSREMQQRATAIFGPFMKEWGYDFPNNWQHTNISVMSSCLYVFSKFMRSMYSKIVKGGPLSSLKIVRNLVE